MKKTLPVAATLSLELLEKDTLQDRIYRQLSNLILDGDIAPGYLVTIQALADSLGVSAMPVREAFKRLTAAGALTVISGRSIGIPPLSIDRLDDLKKVRMEIETATASWAVSKFNARNIEILEQHYKAMDEAIAKEDIRGFLRGNRAFHFHIYQTADSPVMMSIIETLWLQISPYFNLLYQSGNPKSANHQHAMMIKAIKNKDEEMVNQALSKDIDGAYKILLTLLHRTDI